MNSNEYGEEQWFPQLPEGYVQQPGSQDDWNATAMHVNPQQTAVNGWNQQTSPGWNDWQNPSHHHQQQGWPGWPNSPQHPGWPGFPQQPNWPWQGGGNQPTPPPGPGGGGNQQSAPTSPPPSQTPAYPDQQLMRVDPGGIRGCMFRYTYIWTSRNRGFWFFPTFVGRTSVAGFQWNNQWRRWVYTGIDLDRIDAFTCI
ncbi:hypothetical protein H9659_11160 [Sporosarcina sp. Sa3CUA8]|uniref:Transporter n=2 Tax=Sporosarcina gallistercoris TaxID=2762245 RepID=A0ABR8PL32_9BACL|nr:hypothetical protein [Sporosarcina gallistercoris]